MSTAPTLENADTQANEMPLSSPSVATVAVCLPSMPAEGLSVVVERLQEAFAGEPLLIAAPHQMEDAEQQASGVRFVAYPVQRGESEWVLDGADYAAAARLAQERSLSGVLLLGTEAATLSTASLRSLRQTLRDNADLGTPRYLTGPQEGLVNSAFLYPLTRALFGLNVRFPLPLDAALSQRLLTRLSAQANRAAADGGLVWPVAEAASAGFTVREADGVERTLPRPQEADLNVLLPAVASSLFTDIENRAAFWQRPRVLPPPATSPGVSGLEHVPSEEIYSLVEGFRLAFTNLREIWSLVAPPQSLLALKKLSNTPVESFSFPASLWARVVYDFGLAFHLRTLNRGHLLGSMTPLYLAWVASFLQRSAQPGSGAAFLEETARAFEQEKPYFVSRWRWPDRFNP